MPVHYGSQIDEHHAVRRDAGMFDVSHMLAVDVERRRRARLPALRARQQRRQAEGAGQGALLVPAAPRRRRARRPDRLFPARGLVPPRRQRRHGRQGPRVAAARSSPSARRSSRSRRARDLAMIAVQGPHARANASGRRCPAARAATEALKPFNAALRASASYFIARTGYTGEDGFEIMLPATRAARLWQALAAAGVKPCGLGARDTLRLEAGMNLYGQDMDEARHAARVRSRVDRRPRRARAISSARRRCSPRIRRAQLVGLLLQDTGRRAAQPPAGAHRARRRRDHQRHLLADAGPRRSRSRALPAGVAPGDIVARRRARQARSPRAS